MRVAALAMLRAGVDLEDPAAIAAVPGAEASTTMLQPRARVRARQASRSGTLRGAAPRKREHAVSTAAPSSTASTSSFAPAPGP